MYDDLHRLTSGSLLVDDPHNCHKCRFRPAIGHVYYVGRRRWEWPDPTPYYDIAGESELRLCEECFGRVRKADVVRTWLGVIGAGVAAAGYVGWLVGNVMASSRAHGWQWEDAGRVGSAAFGALWYACLVVIVGRTGALSRSARGWRIRRYVAKMWKARGYNAILLPEEYERLLQRDRIRRIPMPL